jgi:hypothetical protein
VGSDVTTALLAVGTGKEITVTVDPNDSGQGVPYPAHGGLERAVAASGDASAEQALSRLRQAGASLLVTVDAEGRPQTVVPVATLVAARAGQRTASCQPAWAAATFIQPASAEDARRLAAHNENQPFVGHRTVVIQNGQLAGVVPVPGLINRPGPTSAVLERVLWTTGTLIARIRYGRMVGALLGPPLPPGGSS